MVFEEIKICNLFSYRDLVTFDLSGHSTGRSITLISGRNGFGKTSFLNSIKLLFSGPIEELRKEVRFGHKLNPKYYMLGRGEEWMGVFNRLARSNNQQSEYYVQCRWQEEDGSVRVRREWFPDGEFDPNGQLTVQAAFIEDDLQNDDAQQFLEKRLPASYLSFFFFDGEKIQELAEMSSDQVAEHVEGILNITPVNTLMEYLGKVKNTWAREGAVGEAKKTFNDTQRTVASLQDHLSVLEENISEKKNEIDEIKSQTEDLERRKRHLQGLTAQQEEGRLKEKQQQVQNRLAELRQDIVDNFIPQSPLMVNPDLVKNLIAQLKEEDQKDWSKIELLNYLRQHLPQIFERQAPPAVCLKKEQKQFYKNRLNQALDECTTQEELCLPENTLSWSREQQSILRHILTGLVETNHLYGHASHLNEISHLARQADELTQKIEEINTDSEGGRDRYVKIQEQLKILQTQQESNFARLGDMEGEQARTKNNYNQEQKTLQDQEVAIIKASEFNNLRQKAEILKEFYSNYKEELKKQRRKALETSINAHFKTLMTSHGLIDHIHVDEYFGLHFLDNDDNALGRANMSAGMKQLIAIALVWALKDVSGKSVPVIVDTPLARIDRENQENLLRDYFPHAAEQVIILPTDSELDRHKYKQLSPFIYREYQLDNPQGDNTQRLECSMYRE